MRERRHPFQMGWWRRYLPFAGGFLVVATLLAIIQFNQSSPVGPAAIERTQKLNPAKTGDSKAELPSKATKEEKPETNLSPVEKFVKSESPRIGRPDPDPAKSHARLKAVAKSLGRKDIDALKRTALNTSLNNDRRFLSVYLLAISGNQAASSALMSVALAPLSIQDTTSIHYAEELMIRTQALEGLARQEPGALRKVLSHQDNAFLADQTKRLLKEQNKAKR